MTGIFLVSYVLNMNADALIACVARSSAAILMVVCNGDIFLFPIMWESGHSVWHWIELIHDRAWRNIVMIINEIEYLSYHFNYGFKIQNFTELHPYQPMEFNYSFPQSQRQLRLSWVISYHGHYSYILFPLGSPIVTSWNGNALHITGPLWGGYSSQTASNADLWYSSEQTIE